MEISRYRNFVLNLELKSILTQMKNLLEGFKGRFGQAEEIISKLEKRKMDLILSGTQKKNKLKKSEQSMRDLVEPHRADNTCTGKVQKENRERGRENT